MVFFATLYGFCKSSHLYFSSRLNPAPAVRPQERKITSRIIIGLAIVMYTLSVVFFALSWDAIRTHYLSPSKKLKLITSFKPWHDMTSSIVLTVDTLIADFTFVRRFLLDYSSR